MAQFDVHRNPRGGRFPLVLDIQTNLLARLVTRVVVPLSPLKRYGATPIKRLNPTAMIGAVEYVLVFQDLASVPIAVLGEPVTSLEKQRDELVAAIDLLFTGI